MNEILTGSERVVLAARGDGATAGITAGSIVLTLDGECPVERMRPGMRVITRDGGMAVLLGVKARQSACAMVRVTGGSLGHTRPGDDALLPSGQQVLLRDWRAQALFGRDQALAPLSVLVDGEFVRDAGSKEVTLYHLVFDTDHILYVDGLELACEQPEALSRAA